MELLVEGTRIGVVATIAMDLFALLAQRSLRLPTADWALMGRWFGYWSKGVLVHRPIASSPPLRYELAFGWTGHYVTGAVYGTVYLGAVEFALQSEPSVESTLAFGIATLAAPWLFVQPSIGAGAFAAQTPRPWITRLANTSIHVVFGGALFVGWAILR